MWKIYRNPLVKSCYPIPPRNHLRRLLTVYDSNLDEARGGDGDGDGGGGGGTEEEVRKLRVFLQNGPFDSALALAKTLILSHETLFPSPSHLHRYLSHSVPPASAASVLITACASLNRLDDALSVLADSRPHSLRLRAYNSLLEALVSARRYTDALSLFSRIPSPNTSSFNSAIQAAVKSGDVGGGIRLLSRMQQSDRSMPGAFAYNVVISALWKARRGNDARKLFDEMLERKIEPTLVTYNTMIDGYCKGGNLDAAFGVRERMRDVGSMPNITTYNSLLSGLCRAGAQEAEMKVLLEEMEAIGLCPNGFTDIVLFDGYEGCADMNKGFRLNSYTCSIVLNWLCKQGNVPKAEKVLESCCLPTTVIYNTIVDGYCRAGDLDGGFSVVRRMKSHGLAPNCVTYNSFINGMCKLRRMGEAEEMVKEMGENGVPPSTSTFNSLLNAYGRAGQFERCFDILEEMQAKWGLNPNTVSYGSIISGFCKKEKLNEAEAIFQGMLSRDIHPNEQIYNILIDGYLKSGFLQHALRLLEDMRRKGIAPSIVTYNSLIHGLCCLGSLREAENLLSQLRNVGLNPNVITYNSLISAYCNTNDIVKPVELYDEMEKLSIKPNLQTYYALISQMGIEGTIQKIENLHQHMLQRKLIPDKGMYSALVSAYAKCGDSNRALSLMQEMKERGILAAEVTFTNLAMVSC